MIQDTPNYNVYKFSLAAYIFSGALILLSTAILLIKGLNIGVDFSGGTMIDFSLKQNLPSNQIDSKLHKMWPNYSFTFHKTDDHSHIIKIKNHQTISKENNVETEESDKSMTRYTEQLKQALRDNLGEDIVFNHVTSIGPQISGGLVKQSILAFILSLFAILIYLTLRFNLYFAIAGCLILLHDIFISIGMISLTAIEVNLTSIAAILTIMGYCINDTVVIYDRIRNNIQHNKQQLSANQIVSISVIETLKRSIITSLVTLLAVIGILFFSSQAIKNFAIIVGFGIIVGTYGSILISSFLPLRLGYKMPIKNINI